MQQYLLLQTKLYTPPIRPELVSRPRLIERLNAGLNRKLTVICAPAGFGKTTLASEWVAASGRPAAWLSLDEGDNDPTRFLTYFVAALQTLVLSGVEGTGGEIGKEALSALQAPQPPPLEIILTSLINELAAIPERALLVLDDYHLIEAQPIHEALTFLLEHLPPPPGGIHLVIATREDPPLPLARLRARGQLTELRASDLRFTPSEAASFLNQAMGLNLSAEEIAALETRTEGWIAGLQLAALALQGPISIQGRADTASFIQAFTGSHRYILDYLVEEILQRQPERVRSFLLQTAILDRLCGPLCDAVRFGCSEPPSTPEGDAVRFGVAEISDRSEGEASSHGTAVRLGRAETYTKQGESRRILEALERGNLFVVPLDDERRWYRYHHLFADVLRAHLMEEQPHQVPVLHRRASKWYEHNGSPPDAIRHALAAEDFERAADLVELARPAWSGPAQSVAWLGWAQALPDEVARARPVLSVAYAQALLNAGKLEAAEARLRDTERWLETTNDRPEDPSAETRPEVPVEGPDRRMVVVDEAQFQSLAMWLATTRAYHAKATGDVPATVRYTRRALDLLPEEDHLLRASLTTLLGLTYWAQGDLEAAYRTVSDGLASMQRAGNLPGAIGGAFVQADLAMTLGHLHKATSIYERALQLAAGLGQPVPAGTEDVHTGLSGVHRERGDLEAAAQDLVTSRKLGEQAEVPDWQYRWCIAQARLEETLGNLDGALDLLDEAERLYVRTPLPDVRPIAARKAWVWVKQGSLAEALGWARERELSVGDDLSYLREFEHIILARLLIAQYKSDRVDAFICDAVGLVERLLQAAEEGKRTGSVIEILVLQALAHEAQGEIPPALSSLERALTLAEPEGYLRIFVDEGPPMARLLYDALSRGIAADYVRQLLAAFPVSEPGQPLTLAPKTRESEWVEPLTKRELEVLQLIADGLTNQEIATKLFLSLNTVKAHTRNIYGKLDVHHRTGAVARARALGLLLSSQ